ncbi:MAG: ATP-binding cassette domain-containing protein [Planctomycetaceae bacterium]|nr:ATP-binding cassette domain-containing protein [Planctomycetaceae bacterium]
MSAPILRMEAVERHYESAGQRIRVLGPVDLELARGEFVAIMGPSGAGKSTLLGLAGALDRPDGGAVFLDGQKLWGLRGDELAALRRRKVGYVFQDLNLVEGLTALENTRLPLELDGLARRKADPVALAALERVGLGELAHRFPEELSGGERQRVAIARAFVGPRELLLADEPTGALDSLAGETVMRHLRTACDGGKSALLVTHDARHAAWADRVLHLVDGRFAHDNASVGGR